MREINFNSPSILFRPQMQEYIFSTLIQPKVNFFLDVRDIDFNRAVHVESHFSVTDLNFESIKINYFYNRLLKDIKKNEGIIQSIFYTITYDKRLAVMECDETKLFYNEMYLGKQPFFYFIYFNLQELLDGVRELKTTQINVY